MVFARNLAGSMKLKEGFQIPWMLFVDSN